MNSQKLRLWLAVLIFVTAVGVLLVSSLPTRRIQQVLPLPPVQVPSQTPIGRIAADQGV